MVLEAVALHMNGEKDKAVHLHCDALALAAPGSFIRLFVDEGLPMAHLLSEVAAVGLLPDYTGKLLAVWEAEAQKSENPSSLPPRTQPLIEPLSPRELEVLHLMAQGLSNQEMCERLFLALSTVKGHNRTIFGKLRSNGAPKRSHVPANWVCYSLARTPGISMYQYAHNKPPNTPLVSLCSHHGEDKTIPPNTPLVSPCSYRGEAILPV